MMYADVVAAVRTAGNRAGALRLQAMTNAFSSAAPVEPGAAALMFARMASPSIDTATVRELELEIAAMNDDARSLACVVAPALAPLPEAKVIERALTGFVGATSAVLGAVVPWAIAIDATLLQALRDAPFGAARLSERPRRPELARRIARALGVPVIGRAGQEDAATSAKKLREIDSTLADEKARANEIEQAIRSRLPRL